MAVDSEQILIQYAAEVLHYVKDLLHLAHSSGYDEPSLWVYQGFGRSLAARYSEGGQTTKFLAELSSELAFKLEAFGTHWQPCTGFALERLWKAFRPPVIKSVEQYTLVAHTKNLAERFDGVKWNFVQSMSEHVRIQKLLANVIKTDGRFARSPQEPLEVDEALDVLEKQPSLGFEGNRPHFAEEFDTLRQYSLLHPLSSMESFDMLDTLSERPTAATLTIGEPSRSWTSLKRMSELANSSHAENFLTSVRPVFSARALHKLEGISEVPLRALNLLKTEMTMLAGLVSQLGTRLTRDPLKDISDVLQDLRQQVYEILHPLSGQSLTEILKHIVDLPHRLNGQQPQTAESNQMVRQLRVIVKSLFAKPVKDRNLDSTLNRSALLHRACEMIYFFAGLILLYLPDRPHDPALKAKVERERHMKREADYKNKLKAIQLFERIHSGQSDSYRANLVQEDLRALGETPEEERIYRPDISEMVSLQPIFSSILRTVCLVVAQVMEPNKPTSFGSGGVSALERQKGAIHIAISRLSNQQTAYGDIAQPLIAMLYGLEAGMSMALLGWQTASATSRVVEHICSSTPFMSFKGSEILQATAPDFESLRSNLYDPRVHFLEEATLVKAVDSELRSHKMETTFQVYHQLYEEWKDALEQGKLEHASKSSLYQYRGEQAGNDAADDEEMEALFPDADFGHRNGSIGGITHASPADMARQLVVSQKAIFESPPDPTEQLLKIIRHSSQYIANLWADHLHNGPFFVPVGDLLSSLHLTIAERKRELHDATATQKSYNFYTSENIVEAEKLLPIVARIQMRFLSLHESWPEHATPSEVLQTCSELLLMRHIEPIAKLLTKSEQLHGHIHEWQAVASKEYSASTQYDDLTQLLVNWRRLELSTWSRLLDLEDEKCKADADSWWFVAYETVVAAPLSTFDRSEDLSTYVQQLIATLEEFLATTCVGQFHHRLAMLQSFQRHIALLAEDKPCLGLVSGALYNFLSYHRRYEPSATETLRSGRLALEKELKEVLLLASWKDTNINALRESAKRSHNKLVKLIRRYRGLLAQPVSMLFAQVLPEEVISAAQGFVPKCDIEEIKLDLRAKATCEKRLEFWATKPKRFTKPEATAQSMLQITPPISENVNVSDSIERYVEDLVQEIKSLQKASPDSATKDNLESIKQLRSQKRRLFADVLKDLRQMGFSTNVSKEILKQQASLAAILSRVTSFEKITNQETFTSGEKHFQNLINGLPRCREVIRGHHDDLSHSDVSRSVGFLESMLFTLLGQKSVIASNASALMPLNVCVSLMSNVWKSASVRLRTHHALQVAEYEVRTVGEMASRYS